MCIKKVESYAYAGKLYATEAEATLAALTSIANRIVKEHADSPIKGLLAHGEELTTLLPRHAALEKASAKTSVPPYSQANDSRSDSTQGAKPLLFLGDDFKRDGASRND